MHKARFVFALATSTMLAWTALSALDACSSDPGGASNISSGSLPSVDSGKDANLGDTSTPLQDSSPPEDAGSDCGKPAALHAPKADGGIFCPFSAPPGGKNVDCAESEQCCQNPKGAGVSTCVTKGAACPVANTTVWECEDPSNCAGKLCCAHSGDGGTVTIATDTCGDYLSKFSGTRCSTVCAPGELVVCEQQSECSTGRTCTAVKPKGNDIGVCK